jgi:hypothetical protein
VAAAVAVYEHGRGQNIAPWPFLYGVAAFLIVAFYRTWQEEHHRVLAMEEEAQQANKAHLRVRFLPSGNTYRFVIANHGPADAADVQMSVAPVNGRLSPIPRSELDKLPVAVLTAGDSRAFVAALSLATGGTFDFALSWTNADGSPGQRKQQVSV